MLDIELRRVHRPDFGNDEAAPTVPRDEYDERLRRLSEAIDVDWIVVYGDREHSANLAFLTGFDPRFEEALLLLGKRARVLIVGNEGEHYASLAAVPLDVVVCQSLSLLGQPRNVAPRLEDALRRCGVARDDTVGVAGWKYLEEFETHDPTAPSFVPAFVVETLRRITAAPVVDCTRALMHPVDGLRAHNSAAQIAAFEWAAVRASEAVLRIVAATQPGLTELEATAQLGYAGEPLSCHVMFASGSGSLVGLRSPTARRIEHGDGATTAVGYWGGLCCRAGLVTSEADDSFLNEVVFPYYRAVASWYRATTIGATGADIHEAVMSALAGARFGPMLNPGHQISLDEWMNTPIRADSPQALTSGMMFQCDIIPFPLPPGWALNCEDTIALAGPELRAELERGHPASWRRIADRQRFMREELGLQLSDDVLPLSAAPAYLAPFWLEESLVCAVSG